MRCPPPARRSARLAYRRARRGVRARARCRRKRRSRSPINGSTHAVMMATPADLEDFAIGFTLTEGIVGDRRRDIEASRWSKSTAGIDLQIELADGCLPKALERAAAAHGRAGRLRPLRHREHRARRCARAVAGRRARCRFRAGDIAAGGRASSTRRAAAATPRPAPCMPPASTVPGEGVVAGARGCRPAQCARQARRRARAGRHRRRARARSC